MAEIKPEIHVISNTHCDKEYIFSGPRTRAIVVRTLDDMIRIFREVPQFKCFHLDSQTSPLDTYLSVKPEKQDELKELVRSGRLLVGPWYTLPDPFQISGEASVRNLLFGHRRAKEFGQVMKVGYNIFGWGQLSQLPQIYRGFDIDSIIFYRGINETVSPKLEFRWQSPDGSEVIGLRYAEGYRLNFFHFVFLPVAFGRCHWGCPPYDWKNSNGVMFNLCDVHSKSPSSFLVNTRLGMDESRIPASIDRLLSTFEGTATTPYYLTSMGWDDGMPYAELPQLIDKINAYLGDRAVVIQSSLPEYINKLRSSLKDLHLLVGEMRHENSAIVGGDTRPPLFAGVLSARVPMNLRNAEVEFSLEKFAEPYSIFAWMLGREYMQGALDEAWLALFTNHSHDCIGGTHTDSVYSSVLERYSQAYEIAETEVYHSIQHIAEQINTSDIQNDESALIVFNSLPYSRTDIIQAVIDTPVEENYKAFILEDDQGKRLLPQANYSLNTIVYLHQVHDYPLKMDSRRFDFFFEALEIPPFGYKTFRVKFEKGVRRNQGTQVVDINTMQNEHIRVKINENGTLDVTERKTGKTYSSLYFFEDRGEIGGPCMPQAATLDRVINSLGEKAEISLVRDGSLVTTFRVTMTLNLPRKAVVDQGIYPFPKHMAFVTPFRRSEETVPYRITSDITLLKGSRRVDIVTEVDNTAEDHRLRVLFPTGFSTDEIDAECQFDVVRRKIRRVDSSQWFEDAFHTQPHRYFLDVSDGKNGLAILTRGTHEYEYLDYENKTVAITMLRCLRTGPESRTDPLEPGAQTPGKHTFHFAIYPHSGNWEEADVYQETYCKHVPLRAAQMRANPGTLPRTLSFMKLSPAKLVLSAIKLSERGDSIIVRFHNPTDREIQGSLECWAKLQAAYRVSLEEERQEELKVEKEKTVRFSVAGRKILTLELKTSQ